MRLKSRFSPIMAAILLAGCTTFSSPAPEGKPDKNLEIEVFAARGFLGGTDYEQYKLASGVVWRECGAVAAKGSVSADKAKGDQTVFRPDSSLDPQERRVDEISKAQLSALSNQASRVVTAAKNSTHKLSAPGSLFSLTQPGLVEIAVTFDGEKQRFITSVDEIADQSNPISKELHELFGIVRGIGKPICNANSFYGIRRKEF